MSQRKDNQEAARAAGYSAGRYEAADLIDTLQAENARLTARIEELERDVALADRVTASAYEAMTEAIQNCQTTVDEFLARSPDCRALSSSVFGALDIPLANVGSFVRRRARAAFGKEAG